MFSAKSFEFEVHGDIVSVQARVLQRFDSCCGFVAANFADGSVGHIDLIISVHRDFEEGF